MKSPQEIIELMLEKDTFSAWMGLEIISLSKGNCVLQSTIQNEMLNGFEILHGGISYSLADSALAFASNSHGYKCVSIETSISHIRPSKLGDTLTATATELHRGKMIGIYQVVVSNQEKKQIALFKGTVHISDNEW